MIRYFRYTIEWDHNQDSDVIEIDIPEGTSGDEVRSIVTEIMWNDMVANNVDGFCREIAKEEYEAACDQPDRV